jgi:RHS repeat-associated protein
VQVYRNGQLLGTRDVTAWPYYAQGGYIGLWFISANQAVFDDFGGGTVTQTGYGSQQMGSLALGQPLMTPTVQVNRNIPVGEKPIPPSPTPTPTKVGLVLNTNATASASLNQMADGLGGDTAVIPADWIVPAGLQVVSDGPVSANKTTQSEPPGLLAGLGGESRSENSLNLDYNATTTQVTISYTYDSLYRLTDAVYSNGFEFHYTYDAVGNRLTQTTCAPSVPCGTTTYTYDAANRLISVDGVACTWDDNGNLLNDGTSTYAYDSQNRLTALTQGGHTYTFSYNGHGDRLTQSVDGVVTRYTLDLETDLTQVLSDGSYAYLYGNDRLAQANTSGTDYFLGDALGSVRQLVDGTGAVKLAKNYEPYGTVLGSTGSGVSTFGYTGESHDATGLTFLRARYYSGQQGRFVSRDPWNGNSQLPGTHNAYLYGLDNPMMYVDPSGQWCVLGIDVGPDRGCSIQERLQAVVLLAKINRRIEGAKRFNQGFALELVDTLAMGIPGLLGHLSDWQVKKLTESMPWLLFKIVSHSCGAQIQDPEPLYATYVVNNPDPNFQAGRLIGRTAALAASGAEIVGGIGGALGSALLEIPSFGTTTITLGGTLAIAGHGAAVMGAVAAKEAVDPLILQGGIIVARAINDTSEGGGGTGAIGENAPQDLLSTVEKASAEISAAAPGQAKLLDRAYLQASKLPPCGGVCQPTALRTALEAFGEQRVLIEIPEAGNHLVVGFVQQDGQILVIDKTGVSGSIFGSDIPLGEYLAKVQAIDKVNPTVVVKSDDEISAMLRMWGVIR